MTTPESTPVPIPISMTLPQALHLYNTGFPINDEQTVDGFFDRFELVEDSRLPRDMETGALEANAALMAITAKGGSLLWVGDNFLAAHSLSTVLAASGYTAAIFWDLLDPEVGGCEHVVVTNYSIL